MRQIIMIFSWLVCFYLPQALAQQQADATSPGISNDIQHAMPAIARHGALFKITSGDHTLFLFGTIHVGRPDFYPLEENLMQALAQASKIALELDPLNAPALQQAVQKYGFYPAGDSLHLKPTLQNHLTASLKKYGIPYSTVAQMKPWLVADLLTIGEYAIQGYQAELAVDAYLSGFAHRHGKPIVELETADSQLSLFGKLSIADQILYLEQTMQEIEDPDSRNKMIELVEDWRKANPAKLQALSEEMAHDTSFTGKFLQRVLLDERNPGLSDGIEKLMLNEKNAFAAIGILHLIGNGSVPALLSQRGYTVEQLY